MSGAMELNRNWLLIGLGAGMVAMVICAGLMILLLVFRRRYLEKDNYIKTPITTPFHGVPYAGDSMDMTRSMAWSPRHGSNHTDLSYDPTLRPLHIQNDPFFHREWDSHSGEFSHNSSPRGTVSSGKSGQSGRSGWSGGRNASVPYRQSNLPATDTSYSEEGRPVHTSNGHAGHSWAEDFPGKRIHRPHNHSIETSLTNSNEDYSNQTPRSYVGNTQHNQGRNYQRWRSNSPRDSLDLRDVYY